jgi:hypothetical protein
LRRGGPPGPPGNLRALGVPDALLERLLAEVEQDDRELLEAVAELAPLRDEHGRLPAADTLAVERAAAALKRWRLARRLERQRADEVEGVAQGAGRRAAGRRLVLAQRIDAGSALASGAGAASNPRGGTRKPRSSSEVSSFLGSG